MRKFIVEGMTCAACSSRVEKAVSALNDVESCSVNLLTKTMIVEGKISDENVISAVTDAGYTAYIPGGKSRVENEKKNTSGIRFVLSVLLTLFLMYFSMGCVMWDFPVPYYLDNPLSVGIIQLILSISVIIINKRFFINGLKGFVNKSPNMDSLVSLGSGISFVYSLVILFIMAHLYSVNNIKEAAHQLHNLYFESAAMILTLISLGKLLEEGSKGKTTNAISLLMKLTPKTATVIINGKETDIPAENLKKGDLFIVRPGCTFPADGVVLKGESSADESSITGESIPVDKKEGDKVTSATVNLSGYLECEATQVGEDTTLAGIIKSVSDAAAGKAPVAKVANKVSAVFVPVVIVIAIITFIIWFLCTKNTGYSLMRGISVLVISCPCALGLATPVAIMVGNGVAAKNKILFKTAEALEETGRAKIVVLDKTGTVTEGKPEVTDVFSENVDELIRIAASLEIKSEHPLAKAIVKYAENKNVNIEETESFRVFPGNGLTALYNRELLFGGKPEFVKEYAEIDTETESKYNEFASMGKTPLLFGKNGIIKGIIAVSDKIKEDSKDAVSLLKNMGISVVMLTGDNKETAAAVAKEAGILKFSSGLLPEEKEKEIQKLKKSGKVIMVGDGINDAPALTSADIGMAIGAGTDIAMESADIVLARNSLADVFAAIKISKATLKNIKENLFWAFCYNIIGIPLAAGAFVKLFGWEMSPMFGAMAMSVSSFIVVTNSLRLNYIKLYKTKENKIMEKILKVEGMMCPHCEARVKTKLEELDGVVEVIPSHETKTVVVKAEKDIADSVLAKVIEEQGYKVI